MLDRSTKHFDGRFFKLNWDVPILVRLMPSTFDSFHTVHSFVRYIPLAESRDESRLEANPTNARSEPQITKIATMASSSVAIPPYQEDVPLLQKRDMIAARQRATFNPSSMTSILFSAEATAKRRRAADLVLNEKLLTDAIAEWPFLGRTERMQRLMPIIVGWT